MKIERTRGSVGVKPGAETSRSSAAAPAGPAPQPREIQDTTSILGVPEQELTPKVRTAIMTLLEEVAGLREELERSKARLGQLERLADEDSLIPVANRRAFVRELSRVISYSQRYGTPSSLLFFDLNGMKQINDSFGHAAGDAALKRVAELLLSNVRESDIVGRLGGDEFGVILVHSDAPAGKEKAVELARVLATGECDWQGRPIDLSVAYGVYTFSGKENALDALAAADHAMYAHKQSLGRNNGGRSS
jgi:diguanylate cyclase (GGDEF)-like protein